MPTYEYRCERGHNFEILQRMADDRVTTCEVCDASVERVMNPIAVHFKGSGFYTTDNRKKGWGAGEQSDAKKNGSSGDDSGSKGQKKDDSSESSSKKSESKAASSSS